MMETLIVRLSTGDDGETLVQWALFRGADRVAALEQPTTINVAFARLSAPTGASRRVVALVPGADVLLTEVAVPAAQRRHLARILPSLMEDRLAEDVELAHLAAGATADADGNIPVAAIRASLMMHWLGVLREADIHPQAMASEIYALPTPDNDAWQVLHDGTTIWLRMATHAGMVTETSALPAVLATAIKPARAACVLIDGADAAPEALSPLANATMLEIEAWHGSAFDYLSREILQAVAADAPMLNLLQGPFSAQAAGSTRASSAKLLRLAAAVFLLAILLNGGQGVYFSLRAQAAQAQVAALYHRAFPADTRIVDAVAQMKNHLKARQTPDDAGFLALLGTVATRVGPGHPFDLQTLAYGGDDGKLTLDVTAPTIEGLSGVVQRVDGSGLAARLVSVNRDADTVQAQLAVARK